MGVTLEIRDLHVTVEDKPILRGVNLTVSQAKYTRLWGQMALAKAPWRTFWPDTRLIR